MMNICSIVLFLFIMNGVFAVDTEDVKMVTEGDSLTLQTDFTEIQKDGLIEWKCNGTRIAKINKQTGKVEYSDKIMFSDRLTLDQTGFLTIWNIRMKHSGEYKVEGTSSEGTEFKTFRVIVKESPLKTVEDKDEIKTLSVTEGNTETLQTDTELQKHDLILWRFGAEGSLIAKGDIEENITSYYDGRFRDRLKMDSKTGSLTITDIKTEHAGEYQLKIISDRRVLFKRFTVTVSTGLSSGPVAGIVLLVLLLVFSAAVAACVINFRRKISDRERQKYAAVTPKMESVIEGGDVTLKTDVPEIKRDDQMEWRYEEYLIAQIKGETSKIYKNVLDGKFRKRLNVDQKTGSLTITNTEMRHAGVYQLKIKSGREVLYKKFIIIIRPRIIPMEEGESVTLHTKTEIQREDQILWKFGESLLARIKDGNRKMFDVPGERFRDSLELDKATGSLTIKKMRYEESGLYKLEIRSSRGNTYKRFFVTVNGRKSRSAPSSPPRNPQKAGHRKNESATVEMPLLSDVNNFLETRSLC